MIAKQPADEPDICICQNAARPDLVLIAIGTGTNPYSVTPELAEDLAAKLSEAAAAARAAGGHCE